MPMGTCSRSFSMVFKVGLCVFLMFPVTIAIKTRQFVLFFSDDAPEPARPPDPVDESKAEDNSLEDEQWDGLWGDEHEYSMEDLDPGSWKVIAGNSTAYEESQDETHYGSIPHQDILYHSGITRMLLASTNADPDAMTIAVKEFEAAAELGNAHAQSVLGFLYVNGISVGYSEARSFLYHSFAAEGGNFQSKLALAYSYFRRQVIAEAVKLYADVASVAVASFSSTIDTGLVDLLPLNDGMEENKEARKKFRGEENDDFQVLEYQARKGNSVAMFKVGAFYYFGLGGIRRNHQKALTWFIKAVEKGDTTAIEFVGEIYARGHGIERNATKALQWFKAAIKHKHFSAYNGIGYLYVRGEGVDRQNYTVAKDYFSKAAAHDVPDGHYNLGVLYLKGKGVKRDMEAASKHFVTAANAGHPKACFQLAKLFHKGIGVKKNLATATMLYKMVAERGPWGSLVRWALESYINGDIGKALLLYSRAAELGYEVAQNNAAWILEKYTEDEYCLGESGFCKNVDRYRRAHTLWWHASEQGNDDAALLIGDAYYYGRGTERDLERAAQAYQHARSQANAQAIFNLGYMHEHGLGLPLDFHLAKRYYDEAVQTDSDATLPVYFTLIGLWLRQHYSGSILVRFIDSFPESLPKIGAWMRRFILDEGNITFATLLVCLLTVLYLRKRRMAAQAVPS